MRIMKYYKSISAKIIQRFKNIVEIIRIRLMKRIHFVYFILFTTKETVYNKGLRFIHKD